MASIRLTLSLALLLVLASVATAAAAPGDLDPSFGTYGKYLSPVTPYSSAGSLVVQSDGKIVVGGEAFPSPDGRSRATVFRFTASGEPDPTFGQAGRVVLPGTFNAASVALQGDKIVAVAGVASGGATRLSVFRVEPDGTLDQSFGSGGAADTGLAAYGAAVAITENDRIVLSSATSPIPGLFVARLMPDGRAFDAEFGGGVIYTSTGPGVAVAALAAGPTDEITVLATYRWEGPATAQLLRYRNDGALDPSFGQGGIADVRSPRALATFSDMALRADGSAVAVGSYDGGRGSQGVVASVTATGQVDMTFGTGGAVYVARYSALNAVSFDAQGRILATGTSATAERLEGALLTRYLPDGSADPAFGAGGRSNAGFGHRYTTGRAVATDPDGRIIVAAERITGFRSDHRVLGLMRFLVGEGPRDPDADGVFGKRDRCPEIGGVARTRGCPLIEREVELAVADGQVKGAVVASSRHCDGIGKAALLRTIPGRDELVTRVSISSSGRFRTGFEPRFHGRVYARLNAKIKPHTGLCAAARSNTVSIG